MQKHVHHAAGTNAVNAEGKSRPADPDHQPTLEPAHRRGRDDIRLGLRGWQCATPAARKPMNGKERLAGNIFAIIGFAAGTAVAGCASTGGSRSDLPTSAAVAPNHQHEHGGGDQGGMVAGTCPMQVPGTTVAATEIEGGIGLTFTTKAGSVAELRQRVRRMAEMHSNQRSGGMMMGEHGATASGSGGEHQHGADSGAGHVGGGPDGMMMGGGMMMPAATASVEDIEGGARLILRPNDPAHLATLQEHVRMKAQRMAGGECPMMSLGSGGRPAGSSNPSDADHDAHHPGK